MRTMQPVAAMVASLLVLGSMPALAQPPAASPRPSPLYWESDKPLAEVSAICVFAFQRAAEEETPNLFDAARSCASLDEWMTASAAYPRSLGDTDALQAVVDLCTNEALGLAKYTLCYDVRTSLLDPGSSPPIGSPELASVATAYLAILDANRELSNQVEALRRSAGNRERKLAKAWAASVAQNEALVDSVMALDLPLQLWPQAKDFLDRTNVVLSLERRLVDDPSNDALYARWRVAKRARRDAAYEMRRVLDLPMPQQEPDEPDEPDQPDEPDEPDEPDAGSVTPLSTSPPHDSDP